MIQNKEGMIFLVMTMIFPYLCKQLIWTNTGT